MKPKKPAFPKLRHSKSAALALRAELERIKKMSICERVELALSLGQQHPWIPAAPTSRNKHGDGK